MHVEPGACRLVHAVAERGTDDDAAHAVDAQHHDRLADVGDAPRQAIERRVDDLQDARAQSWVAPDPLRQVGDRQAAVFERIEQFDDDRRKRLEAIADQRVGDPGSGLGLPRSLTGRIDRGTHVELARNDAVRSGGLASDDSVRSNSVTTRPADWELLPIA